MTTSMEGAKGPGTLYLIPVPLAELTDALLPNEAISQALGGLHHFIVENPKTARLHLKLMGYPHPLASALMSRLNVQTPPSAIPPLLEPLLAGHDVGLLSEAGCPAVADPGAQVVSLAHERGIRVVPLVGPSALLLALMGSGLNGQRFAFQGYCPVNALERRSRLMELEKRSAAEQETELFIETPYRNDAFFQALCDTLRGSTRLCVAQHLTHPEAKIFTRTVAQWRRMPLPTLGKAPAVFLFLAQSARSAARIQRNF